jgi:hypothetical protein
MAETTTNPHTLTMTAYPAGDGPYDRWEVTTPTGEVLIAGSFPVDQNAVRSACEEYHHRLEQAGDNQSQLLTSEIPTPNPDIGFLESKFPTPKPVDIGNTEVKP